MSVLLFCIAECSSVQRSMFNVQMFQIIFWCVTLYQALESFFSQKIEFLSQHAELPIVVRN